MIDDRLSQWMRYITRLAAAAVMFFGGGLGLAFGAPSSSGGVGLLFVADDAFAGLAQETAEAAKSEADSSAQQPKAFDQALALATFDYAWKLVRDSYFRKDMNGVDWDAVKAELRPKAARAKSNGQLRVILQDMVGRLHQSHFEVIPKSRPRQKQSRANHDSMDSHDGDKAAGLVENHHEDNDPKEESENHGDGNAKSVNTHAGEAERSENKADESERGESASAGDEGDAEGDAKVDTKAETTSTPADSSGSKEIGGMGIDVRVIGDEVVVTVVRPGSAGDKAGVRPGWLVNFVGAVSMKSLFDDLRNEGYGDAIGIYGWQVASQMMSGQVGTSRTVRFIDGAGEEHAIKLKREVEPGQMVKFGNLPPLHVTASSYGREFEGAKVGVIRFSMWMFPVVKPIGRAMEEFANTDGIVLDLRGNVGGIGGMVMGIGGYFFNKPTSLGTMFQRGQKLTFNVNPRGVSISGKRRSVYRGPVAILLDGESASTTEMFAAGMQATGRARIFGATSAGMALPAVATELPNGDVLLHAIADYEDPNGVSIEGRGVIPDEKVVLSRARLLAGHDDTMEAALRWIAKNRAWKWKDKN